MSWPDFSGADQLRSRCLPAWGAQLEAVKQQSLRALGSFLSPPAAGGPALGEGTTKARPGLGLLRCPPVKREMPTAVAWGGAHNETISKCRIAGDCFRNLGAKEMPRSSQQWTD